MGVTLATASGDSIAIGRLYRLPGLGTPLDRLFVAAIAVCVAASAYVAVTGIHAHAILPAVDLVLDTIAAVVCIALTTLAWARFQERQVAAAVYHAAAFLALATAFGVAVLVSVGSAAGLAAPDQPQALVFAVSQLAAAILFVIAGISTRRRTYGWHPLWILTAPTLAVLLAALIGRWFGPLPSALEILTFTDATGLPHITPFGAVVHVATSVLFFIGAYASRRLWRSNHAVIDGWIAVGLVFAGFAELHWTFYPSAHPGQVSTADLLRLACSACLLAGLASAFRASQRELRMANVELAGLRDAEVERAAMEERTRLARELHDGLAQDLWLAKLRVGELVGMDGLPPEARRSAESAVAAIDIGLADAREAVATLRSSSHDDAGFCNLVRRTAEDHGDRFGLRVEYTFEGTHTASISARTQAEVLRIVQEALSNVARHAGATVVGVRLVIRDDRITLRIADNGRGFDTKAIGREGYGLVSMRERASSIGGRLRISSRVGSGTPVALTAPVVPAASARPRPISAAEQP
jgi:signal transduction histidine kinase